VLPQAVADAEPLIHLAQISKLHLVKNFFSRVLVIPEVKREAFHEGIRLGYSDAQVVGEAIEEGWIIIREVSDAVASAAEKLAEGENISRSDAKTLLLAKESGAEILVDEKILSDLARMYGLRVWNTWTMLLESLRRGFIEISDIESAITELGERRHKLKGKQAAEILKAAKLVASSRKKHDGLEV
jgi:predicted nucleic acid-binding protein